MPNPPTLYFMVGLPGSGKSTFLDNLQYAADIVIHSSDAIRVELFGDVNEQSKNEEVFNTLHKRVKEDLVAGKSVAYDSTGIRKKNRIHFLKQIEGVDCVKKCICVMTPYRDCLRFNSMRERRVPEEVIKRMYENWQPPEYGEGWDSITFTFNFLPYMRGKRFDLQSLFEGPCGLNDFDQHNYHHSATLGKHCLEARDYVREHFSDAIYFEQLEIAALLHDIGKVSTASLYNSKGVEDGDWHYYNHNCTGAYESIFYLDKLGLRGVEMQYISNLIYYHMHPYLAWAQSEKAKQRDEKLCGKAFIEDVYRLHEADEAAH